MKSVAEDSKQRYQGSTVVTILFGFLCLFMIYIGLDDYLNASSPEHFTAIEGIVSDRPHITTGKNKSIEFKIRAVPHFIFQINGATREVTKNKKLLREIEVDDTLLITINKNDNCFKISHNCRANFMTRNINYKWITVVGLSKNKEKYLTLEDYLEHQVYQRIFGFSLAFIMALALVYNWLRERKRYQEFNSLNKNE